MAAGDVRAAGTKPVTRAPPGLKKMGGLPTPPCEFGRSCFQPPNWMRCSPAVVTPLDDRSCLEPISKSPEEDNEAGELDEAEEVLGVVFPPDQDAALPLDPGEEALDEPASHVAA